MSTILLFAGAGLLGVLLHWHIKIIEEAQRALTGEQLKLLTTTGQQGVISRFGYLATIALGGVSMFVFPSHRLLCFGVGLVGSLVVVVASGAKGILAIRAAGLPDDYLKAARKARSVFIASWALLISILFYMMTLTNVGS